VAALFEELDYRPTPFGTVSLRRRRILSLDRDVVEVLLGDEHLMSTLFTAGEIALADLGLAATAAPALDIAVGGLGLGYTARAALDDPRTRSMIVVDAMQPVIDWHRAGLVPLGEGLAGDPRCRLVQGDFFAMARGDGFDPQDPAARFHAVLLDIDHSPGRVLNPGNAAFYSEAGLRSLAERLRPGGVFALWSDEPPEPDFEAVLAAVFATARAEVVGFDNPLIGGRSTNTIYVAAKA
jgi:spermidine synthase